MCVDLCQHPPMTPKQTRKKFAAAVKVDGEALAAVKLQCSTTQVIYIASGKRNPGLRIAVAIEEAYGIAAVDWVERPASRSVPPLPTAKNKI
jgi:transcriptional regulator with XRE-family HTH domain